MVASGVEVPSDGRCSQPPRCLADREGAVRPGRIAGIDLQPHLSGNGHYRIPAEWRRTRSRTGDPSRRAAKDILPALPESRELRAPGLKHTPKQGVGEY